MATDGGQFQIHLIQMAALGRNFSLGYLYDYRKDQVLSDHHLSWGKAMVKSATQIEHRWEKRFFRDVDFNNKTGSLGLDNHLQMSVAAGFLVNFPGASNYINDSRNPSETAFTLAIRLKIQEDHLDLDTLINQEVPRLLVDVDENGYPMATHIVTGVFYGAEAYCVFTQDVDGGEADEEARNEIVQNLSKLALKWKKALSSNQHLPEFKKQFDKNENHLLSRIKCRLYADLQVEPVIKCSFFDAYSHSLGLMKKLVIFPGNVGNSKAIPIAVHLCPLNVLLSDQTEKDLLNFGYRDIDASLASRCNRLFADWKDIVAKAEAVACVNKGSAVCTKLLEFAKVVFKYQEVLKSKLKISVFLGRKCVNSFDNRVKTDLDKALRHPLFRPTKLEHWLNCKWAELEMMEAIASRTGTGVTLAGKNQLDRLLKMSTNKEYSLVLFVPSLDEKTNSILSFMKSSYLEDIYTEDEEGDSIRNVEQPWYLIQAKRKLVLDRVRELALHVEKNTHLQDQVQFVVTFRESNAQFGCSYSVYKAGKLSKKNVRRLPCPPTGLRIFAPETNSPAISATWDYEELGFPCQFLIEYRRKGSYDPWMQQRMNEPGEIQLTVQSKLAMEFRVAADTCIGRSDFSDVVDASSALDVVSSSTPENVTLEPPTNLKVHSITRTSAKLEWTNSTGIDSSFPYHVYVKCWKDGANVSAQEYEFRNYETCCSFKDLQPNSKYFVYMMTIETDWTETSEPTETIEFTTLAKDFQFGETLVERSKKIGKTNGLDLYAVPLTKLKGRLETADRFMFGEPNVNTKRNFRTILLVGTLNSGKTLLVNSLVNYIFGVDLKGPFRFQLTNPSNIREDRITVYDIHHANGFRIDYSLTIIDIPNYVREGNSAHNKEITQRVRTFFDDKNNSIQEVNLVGFVMDPTETRVMSSQLYIYSSLTTIFGLEVKNDVRFLFTCADKQSFTPLFESIWDHGMATEGQLLCFKWYGSIFAESSRLRVDSKDSEQWLKTFENFFTSLDDTKVVPLSKQVLDEKKRLEATVNGLNDLMKTDLTKLQELSTLKNKITLLMENEIDELKLDVTIPHQFSLPYGKYVTNCTVCKVTCHLVCGIKDDYKDNCDVMDHTNPAQPVCRVCPEQCSWKVHRNEPFRWDNYHEKESTSLDAIKEQYDAKLKKNLTVKELCSAMKEDFMSKKASLVKLFETVLDMIKRLNNIEISLNPNPKLQCLDVSESIIYFTSEVIRIENQDEIEDDDERINKLLELRRLAYIYFGHPGNSGRNMSRVVKEWLDRRRSLQTDEDQEALYEEEEEELVEGEDEGEEEETEEDDDESEEEEWINYDDASSDTS